MVGPRSVAQGTSPVESSKLGSCKDSGACRGRPGSARLISRSPFGVRSQCHSSAYEYFELGLERSSDDLFLKSEAFGGVVEEMARQLSMATRFNLARSRSDQLLVARHSRGDKSIETTSPRASKIRDEVGQKLVWSPAHPTVRPKASPAPMN